MNENNLFQIDIVHFQGSDVNGNTLVLRLTNYKNKYSELWLTIKYDGQIYTLPEHPNTLIAKYDNENLTYVSKGIRLEVREPFRGWRLSINTYLRLWNSIRFIRCIFVERAFIFVGKA